MDTTPVPSPSFSSPTPPFPIPEKKPVNWKKILGISAGIIIIFGAGISIGLFLTIYQKPALYVTSTPTPSPITNWKTYKNEEYKFEIKYPADWTQNVTIDNELVNIGDPNFSGGLGDSKPLSLTITVSSSYKIESQWQKTSSQQIQINNRLRVASDRYLSDEAEGSKGYSNFISIPFKKQNIILEFNFATSGCLEPNAKEEGCKQKNLDLISKSQKLIDQILSTFRFEPTNDTICEQDSDCEPDRFCVNMNCLQSCNVDDDCIDSMSCKMTDVYYEDRNSYIRKQVCQNSI